MSLLATKLHAPQFHLILTTRANPPLPLPRLRSRGLLTEIRAGNWQNRQATKG